MKALSQRPVAMTRHTRLAPTALDKKLSGRLASRDWSIERATRPGDPSPDESLVATGPPTGRRGSPASGGGTGEDSARNVRREEALIMATTRSLMSETPSRRSSLAGDDPVVMTLLGDQESCWQ